MQVVKIALSEHWPAGQLLELPNEVAEVLVRFGFASRVVDEIPPAAVGVPVLAPPTDILVPQPAHPPTGSDPEPDEDDRDPNEDEDEG